MESRGAAAQVPCFSSRELKHVTWAAAGSSIIIITTCRLRLGLWYATVDLRVESAVGAEAVLGRWGGD